MNRQQRRAAQKHNPAAAHAGDEVAALLAEARQLDQQGRRDGAVRAYKRVLLLDPLHAEAANHLGRLLQAQGKPREAAAAYARALTLMPQLFDQHAGVRATLVALLPPLAGALDKGAAAWPQRLGIADLFDTAGWKAIADDPLLLCVLQSAPIRDVAFERLLTMLRAALLADAVAGRAVPDATLAFAGALARQCFINEYVFATTPAEDAQAEKLAALPATDPTPLRIAALAMYLPLHGLANADALAARPWPADIEAVLTQQLREPAAERALRAAMPRLTPVDDDTSQRVRQQYEENPYPRWVHPSRQIAPAALDTYLRDLFPTTPFTPLGKTDALDVLVAGCGTGWHTIALTQKFAGARVLAVDLSLASLAYAQRSTPAALAERISYAQADILKLDALDRHFDMVDASGVLHHMADLRAGWRILLSRLRPGGVMHLGLYSEAGRRDVVAARALIAERGYGTTPADIRRCRQDLMETGPAGLAAIPDFFTTSECRDLLFHVQEERVTIPQIKAFVAEEKLRFLGFEFDAGTQAGLRALFSQSGWSLSDLDRWHALEGARPDLFAGMYQFWVQKA